MREKSSPKKMAKYVPIEMVKEYHGKICEHSDVYFAKKGRTLYTGKMCNPRDLEKDPLSANEIAARTKFASARAAVKALTSEEKAAYAEAFANQKKYSTLQGFMFAQEYAKLA